MIKHHDGWGIRHAAQSKRPSGIINSIVDDMRKQKSIAEKNESEERT